MDRYLGIDIGRKTLGIAISDPLKIIAQPIGVINYQLNNQEELIAKIEELVTKYKISKIIYGLPKNMNNTLSTTTKYIIKCIDLAQKKINIPFIAVDERLTSKQATQILIKGNFQKSKRKKLNDKIAAALILKTYLDGHSNE